MGSNMMISGATGGLGKAFAAECASRGYDLYLTDLQPEPLSVLAAGLGSTYGVRVRWAACDLTDPDARSGLFRALMEQDARFCGLINVAGLDFEGLFREQSRERIRTILRLNIEGTLDMIHGLLGLREAGRPFRIINVASLAAFYPMPYKATYAASKRFLLDFSQALGRELAGEQVTVTALCPAGLPTTRECVAAIEAQGWFGHITTQNTGAVAAGALDAALRGRTVYVPGVVNRILATLGSQVPAALAVAVIDRRWRLARQLPVVPVGDAGEAVAAPVA